MKLGLDLGYRGPDRDRVWSGEEYGSDGATPLTNAASRPMIRQVRGQLLAVRDVDAAVADFERLGLVLSNRSRQPLGLETATFGFDNGSYLELMAPAQLDNPSARAVQTTLDQRGEGPYWVDLAVDDLAETADRLAAAGIGGVDAVMSHPSPLAVDSKALWLDPCPSGYSLTQFAPPRALKFPQSTPETRLFTTVYAVNDVEAFIPTFQALGLEVWARYCTDVWGWTRRYFGSPTTPTSRSSHPRTTHARWRPWLPTRSRFAAKATT